MLSEENLTSAFLGFFIVKIKKISVPGKRKKKVLSLLKVQKNTFSHLGKVKRGKTFAGNYISKPLHFFLLELISSSPAIVRNQY